jgi:hypothetical protein
VISQNPKVSVLRSKFRLVIQGLLRAYFRRDLSQLTNMKTILGIVICLLLLAPLQANTTKKNLVELAEEVQRKITKISVIEGERLRTNGLKF